MNLKGLMPRPAKTFPRFVKKFSYEQRILVEPRIWLWILGFRFFSNVGMVQMKLVGLFK